MWHDVLNVSYLNATELLWLLVDRNISIISTRARKRFYSAKQPVAILSSNLVPPFLQALGEVLNGVKLAFMCINAVAKELPKILNALKIRTIRWSVHNIDALHIKSLFCHSGCINWRIVFLKNVRSWGFLCVRWKKYYCSIFLYLSVFWIPLERFIIVIYFFNSPAQTMTPPPSFFSILKT